MKLKRVNTFLVVAIVLINGYTITLPVLPAIAFWWQNKGGKQTELLEQRLNTLTAGEKSSVPPGNRLIIPSMLLDQPVLEGKTARTLNQGLWHRPATSTPDKGGNIVLAGHRLTYTNPRGTLYHLDKVTVGDRMGLWWQGRLYPYRVSEIKTVSPHQTEIEAATAHHQLVIYTCTPLWLPKDRLVVIAQPEKQQ